MGEWLMLEQTSTTVSRRGSVITEPDSACCFAMNPRGGAQESLDVASTKGCLLCAALYRALGTRIGA